MYHLYRRARAIRHTTQSSNTRKLGTRGTETPKYIHSFFRATTTKNALKKIALASKTVCFAPRPGTLTSDVIIKNNICENIGVADGSHEGFAINIGTGGNDIHYISNLTIENNKFISSTKQSAYYGITIMMAESANNILIRNNTFSNFSVSYLFANPGSALDSITIENNQLSGNSNNNNPFYIGGNPLTSIIKNNTATIANGSNNGANNS